MAKSPLQFTSAVAKAEADAYWEDSIVVVCVKLYRKTTKRNQVVEYTIGKHYKLKKLSVPTNNEEYVILSDQGPRFWSETSYKDYFISLDELRDINIGKIIE